MDFKYILVFSFNRGVRYRLLLMTFNLTFFLFGNNVNYQSATDPTGYVRPNDFRSVSSGSFHVWKYCLNMVVSHPSQTR